MKRLIRFCKGPLNLIRRLLARRKFRKNVRRLLEYDNRRFLKYAGAFRCDNRASSLARVIMAYHVIEKGLTMPNRHLGFGYDAVKGLIRSIEYHITNFGGEDEQIAHAIGCVKEYYSLHEESGFDMSNDSEYWGQLLDFCTNHRAVPNAQQRNVSLDELYGNIEAPFPIFAASRHTVRHFTGKVDEYRLKRAVEIALTAPSACNRQYVKIYAVGNHEIRDKILGLQNGNRGFGGTADKLLLVTADLSGIRWAEERNDAFTNAGIMIMNLVYALHYEKVASCILNWSVPPAADKQVRAIAGIPASENIAALILCGNAPEKLMIAASPRKVIEDVYKTI